MKLYHYTTIDTLALILKNRTIRFNRLDKVDDLEEKVVSCGVNLGQYIFASCWTKDSEESIPLWKMYAGVANGIRICLDEDMFQVYHIHDLNLNNGLHSEGSIMSLIPQKDIEANDYMIMPVYKNNKSDFFYRDIEYVDDVQDKTSDIFQDTGNGVNIDFGKVGRYKNMRWAFQKESRFVLNVFPFNPLHIPTEMMNLVGNITSNCYKGNKQLPFDYYDMKLQDAVVDNIEITLSPSMSESKRIIVEALCKQFTKNGIVKESNLSGLVNLK